MKYFQTIKNDSSKLQLHCQFRNHIYGKLYSMLSGRLFYILNEHVYIKVNYLNSSLRLVNEKLNKLE